MRVVNTVSRFTELLVCANAEPQVRLTETFRTKDRVLCIRSPKDMYCGHNASLKQLQLRPCPLLSELRTVVVCCLPQAQRVVIAQRRPITAIQTPINDETCGQRTRLSQSSTPRLGSQRHVTKRNHSTITTNHWKARLERVEGQCAVVSSGSTARSGDDGPIIDPQTASART